MHAWLQNNRISNLEGLTSLGKLQKLYVEDNEISVVEGLEQCANLQELHLSRQRLHGGMSLAFDPNSLEVSACKLQLVGWTFTVISGVTHCKTRIAMQHANSPNTLLSSEVFSAVFGV